MENYQKYIIESEVNKTRLNEQEWQEFLETKKRMGPATHVGLNRALLDFSNRLVPYITEKRFCGKVVYSGGDDVMAVLPIEDLPEYLRSLRAAWCGDQDPQQEFNTNGGYWHPIKQLEGLPNRPHFTMGEGATMSMGIVIAHKSVPLPTVLENLWSAEKERAKKLPGTNKNANPSIGAKDGLCFRVIYGGSNILEALMKGHLLESWWDFIQQYQEIDLSPLLYRLAEELPKHACVTESDRLLSKAAQVILNRREQNLSEQVQNTLFTWLNQWEDWAFHARKAAGEHALGTQEDEHSHLGICRDLNKQISYKPESTSTILNLYTRCRLYWDLKQVANFLVSLSSFYEEVLFKIRSIFKGEKFFDNRDNRQRKWYLDIKKMQQEMGNESWQAFLDLEAHHNSKLKYYQVEKDQFFQLLGRPTKRNFLEILVSYCQEPQKQEYWQVILDLLKSLDYWARKRNEMIHQNQGMSLETIGFHEPGVSINSSPRGRLSLRNLKAL